MTNECVSFHKNCLINELMALQSSIARKYGPTPCEFCKQHFDNIYGYIKEMEIAKWKELTDCLEEAKCMECGKSTGKTFAVSCGGCDITPHTRRWI